MIGNYKNFENDVLKYADRGDLKKLRKAIEKDPILVKKFDEHGLSPLHYAAANGSVDCVELLLMNGAKVNDIVRYGEATALHSALLAKKEETSLLLLKKGANPDMVYQNSNCYQMSAQMGKRFELEFREVARRHQPFKAQTPTSPRQNTSTVPEVPQSPSTPAAAPDPITPPVSPTTASSFIKREQNKQEMKAISPADAVKQASSMLGMYTPEEPDGIEAEKEKELMQYNKITSSAAIQAKVTERRAVLERRMRKCEIIMRNLEPFDDVKDMSTPEARNAISALGFTVDVASAPKHVAAAPAAKKKKTSVIPKKSLPTPSKPAADSPKSEPAEKKRAGPGGAKDQRPPPVSVPAKMVSAEQAAEAIIKHFKSWFDPSVGSVTLPAWYPVKSAATSGGASGEAAARGAAATPKSPTCVTPNGTTLTRAPLADVLLEWTKHLCSLPIVTKDFEFQGLRDRKIRAYIEEFRHHHLLLASQVDMQQDILGDSFTDTKANVDSLRDRVINMLDQYYTVSLQNEDPAILVLAYMMTIGATYFTFQAMFAAEPQTVVQSTKDFVTSLLNIGKVEDGELHAAIACMNLTGLVNSLVYRCNSAQAAQELSFHIATVTLTTRAIIMDSKQGNPRKNEYSVSIGSHLSKMKDLIRTAPRSHRGDPLSIKDDTRVLAMASNYVTQVMMFYKGQIANDDEDGKVLMSEIEKLVPQIKKFADIYIHSREVTLYSWVEVLQCVLDLSDNVCRFCDETVSYLDDPEGAFDAAMLMAKQYALQIVLATTAVAAENPVIPRHHVSFSLRALAIHLVGILDLYYLSA